PARSQGRTRPDGASPHSSPSQCRAGARGCVQYGPGADDRPLLRHREHAMSEALFPYYQNELVFIRQLAQEFSKLYPEAAGRLALEKATGKSSDPHVERLIQAFALLTARVHHKLDDEFPELTDAILSVLYPHYLAPVPSMAVVQFLLDPGDAELHNGFTRNRPRQFRPQPVAVLPGKSRTGYPVPLGRVELSGPRSHQPPFPALKAPPGTAAALRLQLECQGGMTFPGL